MSDKKEFEKKKLENGVISEDALENIAGGIGMSKESLKKYAKKAGVLVLGAGAIAAAGAGAYYGHKQGWFNGEAQASEPTGSVEFLGVEDEEQHSQPGD